MGLILSKFGGKCVSDAQELAKIKDIIQNDACGDGGDRSFIVVAAPYAGTGINRAGNPHGEEQKITDLLYLCYSHVKNNLPYQQVFRVVCERFLTLAAGLKVSFDLQSEFNEIQKHMEHGGSEDYIASRGEYLMAKLMAVYLGIDFVDADGIIFFDKYGRLLEDETDAAIAAELKKHKAAVIPGFYGTMPDGSIKTFVRGGSDITGALVAKALHADIYENWGDREAFLTADPEVVENPHRIEHMTYAELRELSYIGTQSMPEGSIFPVRRAGIPLQIRSTADIGNPGTLITQKPIENEPAAQASELTGIAGNADFTAFSVYRGMLGGEKGILRKVLSIFEDWDINVEHVMIGVDSLSVIVGTGDMEGRESEIVDELWRKIHPEDVVVEKVALMNVVGSAFYHRPGCASKAMAALAKEGISLRMMDQGASEINITLGIAPDELEPAIRAVYKAFLG
ncbi:MAG: aspartate kinase [Firmicutes bacterium]|nr:aspartate kinase [Bacillota bacterium]